ncbi:cellulose synthase complex periplasmic endoglucanase BcsZ, partial [Xanthomonas euvesicatoria pv. euvesicatoria]
MSAHAHTGGMTRRRLLHAGALAGVAAGGGGGGGAPPPPSGPRALWSSNVEKNKKT